MMARGGVIFGTIMTLLLLVSCVSWGLSAANTAVGNLFAITYDETDTQKEVAIVIENRAYFKLGQPALWKTPDYHYYNVKSIGNNRYRYSSWADHGPGYGRRSRFTGIAKVTYSESGKPSAEFVKFEEIPFLY